MFLMVRDIYRNPSRSRQTLMLREVAAPKSRDDEMSQWRKVPRLIVPQPLVLVRDGP